MEMRWAHAGRRGQGVDVGRLVGRLNELARFRDRVGVFALYGKRVRLASLARAEARALGVGRRPMKLDVRPPRTARGA